MPTPTHVNSAADTYIQNQDTVFGDGTDGSTALKATPSVSIAKKTIWDGTAFQLSKQAVAGAITALTGIDSTLTVAQYLATIPTLTDTNWRSLLLSARGELVTSNIDLSGALTPITVADSGSTTVTGQNNQSNITGTPTAGSFVTIVPSGDSSFSSRVSGTFVGTLQFERSVDNVSWSPISADVAGTNFNINQITAIGSFHGNASSCIGVRVRCLTLISGSPIVQLTTGAGTNTVRIGNPLRLFDAVSGVLATIKAASTLPVATDTAIVTTNRDAIITTCTSSSASVTSTSSTALAANAARKYAVLTNIGTGDVYLHCGSLAIGGQGILLKPFGCFEIDSTNLYSGIVAAVTSAGTASLAIMEGV